MEKLIVGGDNLIISHGSDVDGMTPPILLSLFNHPDIILAEPIELSSILKEIAHNKYHNIYITDLPIDDEAAKYINNSEIKNKIRHFDHHESEINSKYSFINEIIEINGEKESAASLFYRYLLDLYPDNKILSNQLLKNYIEAVKISDTSVKDWEADNPSTEFLLGRKLTTLLSLIGKEKFIDKYIKVFKNFDKELFTKEEDEVLEKQAKYISDHIKSCDKNLIKLKIKNNIVGVVITTEFRSEVGNALSKNHPELDYILIVDYDRKSFSFRTVRSDINVFEIAKALCSTGGGHPKAAGMPFCEETKWLLKEIEEYKH